MALIAHTEGFNELVVATIRSDLGDLLMRHLTGRHVTRLAPDALADWGPEIQWPALTADQQANAIEQAREELVRVVNAAAMTLRLGAERLDLDPSNVTPAVVVLLAAGLDPEAITPPNVDHPAGRPGDRRLPDQDGHHGTG